MYQWDLSLVCRNNGGINSKNNMYSTSCQEDMEFLLRKEYGLSKESYYIISNGKRFSPCNKTFGVLHVIPRTYGGKGGFGSMLRAIGAQIEKTTNREACRDLSGRRLRDINEEQRLKNWIAQQTDREREAAERKKKKLERLCQEPKLDFNDDKYDESRSIMTESMSSSVEQGIKASTSGSSSGNINIKRKHEETGKKLGVPVRKKKKLWIDTEESDSSSSESVEKEDQKELCEDNKLRPNVADDKCKM